MSMITGKECEHQHEFKVHIYHTIYRLHRTPQV